MTTSKMYHEIEKIDGHDCVEDSVQVCKTA